MMENDNQQNKSTEESFDNTGLILDFLAHWKWFVLSVIVCLIVAFFYIARQIPTYNVAASIYLSQDNSSSSNAFNMTQAGDPMVALKSYIDETELEVLKSRNNVIKIVDSLKLSYSYYREGTFRDTPLYQNNAIVASMDSVSLRSLKSPIQITVSNAGDNKFDIKAQTYFQSVKEEKSFSDVSLPFDLELSHGSVTLSMSPVVNSLEGKEKIIIYNPNAVAQQLSNSLNIEFAKNSDKIMRINLSTNDPKRGDDIINALLDFYNQNIIEDKNRSAIQTEAFIIDRLVMISDELRDVENRLQAYRQQHNITDINAQSSLNLSLKSDYEDQIAQVETEISLVNDIERIVSSADNYQTLPAVIDNGTIAQIIEAYNKKVTNLNRTLEGSTPDNPLVVNMREELSRDKVRILQNLATHKSGLASKRNSISRLENRSAGQLASTPTLDKGLNEIFREQQVKVNIYTFLLQRREEIALQKTLATNTARLIDDPTGDIPVTPRKMQIYMLAFIIGLAIPAAIIFIRRMIFPIFSDQEELERITSVPVLGEICLSGKESKDEIVVGQNVSTPIAELFRLLRNNISFTRSGVDSRVILVTSSVSGEGKTFISSNLAMTYALMGKRVIVVGLDLRRPMLAHALGFSNQQGVTTFLSGQQPDLNKLICKSHDNDNLYVLPAGPIPPNPNELLMSNNMSSMIAQLREEFDYVILDTAPIGVVSDTFLICRHSDQQLYVTRANFSTKKSLKVLHDAVKSNKFASVYIVLNGVNMASNSYMYRRYGEYGRYKSQNYGYGYTSGTNHKSENK